MPLGAQVGLAVYFAYKISRNYGQHTISLVLSLKQSNEYHAENPHLISVIRVNQW
jgi:hypothetical protein